jgi:HK97 family phage major capsid protein
MGASATQDQDLATLSRGELARLHKSTTVDMKALFDRGDDMTAADLAGFDELSTRADAIKAKLDKFGPSSAIKAKLDGHEAFVKTGVHPAGHVPATKGRGGEGDVEQTESSEEKFIRKGPWKSLGHFAHDIQREGGLLPGKVKDGTLGEWNTGISRMDTAIKSMPEAIKAVTGMSELADADGAAFVPVDISKSVWERAMDSQENLLALTDQTPVAGNGYRVVAWNDKSRSGSVLYGGARAYWGAEGSQGTNVKPATRDISFRLNKVTVLMPVTEELMEDTLALDSRLQKVASACFAYEINKAIVRGDGAGKPLGILAVNDSTATGGGPRFIVAAESGQGASTIVGKNITKMFARRPPSSKAKLVWLYNVDVEPQLDQLNFTAGSTAAEWLYTTSLREDNEPRLKGRRMVECEHCSALGTEGDLILWDPTSYGVIVKSSGINQAVSMHLRFDYGELVYRWAFRMDGRPMWDDVLTPANGNTRAPIITLNSTRT